VIFYRSLGLTLLAVAKGRFPLSGKEDDDTGSIQGLGAKRSDFGDTDSPDTRNAPIGGAGGYWAMIKAICDEEPPSPGPEFSWNFNSFIGSCLGKDAADRLSAKKLLHLPFITENVDFPEMSDSDKSRSAPSEVGHSAPFKSHQRGVHALSVSVDGGTTPHSRLVSSLNEGLPPSSPMTARNATAAVVRRVSRDFSPSAGADFHGRGLDCKSSDAADEETFPYSVRDSIMEEPLHSSSSARLVDYSQSDDTIINAIRLEHLDRVLDKIARKLQQSAASENSPSSPNPFLDAEDEEDDIDDGVFLDLGRRGRGESTMAEVANSSLDSIDKLLFKETMADTPEAKKGRDAYFLSGPSDGGRTMSHSILKSTSSYKHDADEDIRINGTDNSSAPAPRHIHLRDTHKDLDYMHHADDKNSSFVTTTNKGKHVDSYSSSSRSVHFSESGGENLLGKASAAHPVAGVNIKNLRSRMNMKALELEVIDDEMEATEGDSDALPTLPKSSSYFISTKGATSQEHGQDNSTPRKPVPIDYSRMLPKLNSTGVAKWSSLASQLHLPLHLVKIAVKSKLGGLVELWDDIDDTQKQDS
jgi:hypothetical protein